MITILIVLLSLCITLLAREIIKLKKRVTELHNETNTRVASYNSETNNKFDIELNSLHLMLRETEIKLMHDTKEKLAKLTEQINKTISNLRSDMPTTNETLLKEVQQMRNDFFALRQNL